MLGSTDSNVESRLDSRLKTAVTASGDELFVVVSETAGLGRPIAGGNIVDWILSRESRGKDGVTMFDELCWRMVAQDVPLWRAALSIGTLHPQIMGLGFRWARGRGVTEYQVRHGMERHSDYLESPMRPALEQGVFVRHRLEGNDAALARFPLLRSFREAGATDYFACPLAMSVGRHHVVTWTTDRPGGFSDAQIAAIEAVLPALASYVETKVLERRSAILLDTYLGRTIGRHILDGEIFRGESRRLRAALMAVDLRDSTGLADRLPGEELIRLLDDYFEAVAGAVHTAGGEILKFVGDGVLAIFGPEGRAEAEAAAAAFAAATEIVRRIDVANENRDIVGQELIRFGIGLHLGEIYYGNVGAIDRLDYTAIGPAVNLVCRLEGLTKTLHHPILMSESFAEASGAALVPLGRHPMRGLAEPQAVYTPQ
ncbi:MAG TPA: adenylate/guanylate cyclase domain-containing protein [Stellaceae bacterium]|nr:adenylate/guanylate cyclase domain-containing protein [Stellaceae bacterium]